MKPLNIVGENVGGASEPKRLRTTVLGLDPGMLMSLIVYCIFVDCTSTCSTGWVAGLT